MLKSQSDGILRGIDRDIGGNNMRYEDEIYHSGYLDGYYASMELYHADTEMTEEEKARRRKRRRNVALGVAGVAGAGAAGYAIGRALRKKGVPRLTGGSARPAGPTGPRLTGPKLKRVHVPDYDVETPIGWDFKRNKPKYRDDDFNEKFYKSYENMKNLKEYDHDAKKWRYRSF